MKKPVKCLWLALGGLVALAVAVVLVFALTFDPNRYKDEIERMAMERTGRTLRLQGELKLVLFPSLGAGVGGVTLSERGSQREFVSLQSARASVKLLPLLHGQVIVDALRVSGLKAQIVRNKDGSYNFSDLLEGKAEKPGPKRKEQSAPVIFDIAGVDIDRAAVAYRDSSTGQEISLSDLDLHTGPIAENAIGLDFAARLDESSIRGNPAMARTAQPSYHFDLDKDRLEGKGNVALDVAAAGATAGALKRSLSGAANVRLRDGAIKGIDIAGLLRKARAAAGRQSGQAADSKERTDFSELSASFSIKNGVAHNQDLHVKSPLLRIGGSGDIDIGRSTISYVAKASIVAGLTVPVKLAGPLDAMKYEVDYRAVAGDLAQSKVGDKVRDRLEGLLRR